VFKDVQKVGANLFVIINIKYLIVFLLLVVVVVVFSNEIDTLNQKHVFRHKSAANFVLFFKKKNKNNRISKTLSYVFDL